MKWIFDAKPGQVSPLYECGSNDHLLVVALTKVHPAGYRDLDGVKEELKQRAMQAASRFMQELYQKANVTDNRYLFF